MGVDLTKSVAVPDHGLAVPMAMRVVVIVVVTVILRVGIGPVGAIAGLAHGDRHKITLRPQHP